MLQIIDPIAVFSIIMIQIGSKYLVFELTEKQKKIIKHPMMQCLILLSLVYLSTRNIKLSLLIVFVIYIFIYIILNENNPYSILLDNINIEEKYNENII
jgi:hypothetical protein